MRGSWRFPIAYTPQAFHRQARGNLRPFRVGDRQDVVDVVESLQPYHCDDGAILSEEEAAHEGLGLIRDLNDRDKHREPHLVSMSAPVSSPIYDCRFATILTYTTVMGGPIVTGSSVGKVTLSSADVPTIKFTDPFVVSALRMPLHGPSMLMANHEVVTEVLHAFARVVWTQST